MRISIILPYYGSLPKWMPLFLRSVAFNSKVRFFFVTDREMAGELPANLTRVRLSLAEVEQRARQTISPDFRFSCAYKLCDLRPFYGLIFEDLIQGADYWGYCDLDMVFGDLSPVVDSPRLPHADFFWADAGPVVGTFALFRNCERLNRFGETIPDYLAKLNSREAEMLDEIGMQEALRRTPDIRRMQPERLAESQLSISAKGRMVGRTAGVTGNPDEFYWSNGRTFIKAPGHEPQEVMYLHFIGLKRSYHWFGYDPSRQYSEFGFSAAGFQPWKTPPDGVSAAKKVARAVFLRSVSSGRAQIAKRLPTAVRHKLKALF